MADTAAACAASCARADDKPYQPFQRRAATQQCNQTSGGKLSAATSESCRCLERKKLGLCYGLYENLGLTKSGST